MDELIQVLIKIFHYILPQDIISGEIQYDKLTLKRLEQIVYVSDSERNELEISKSMQFLRDMVNFELHEEMNEEKEQLNVFDLIRFVSRRVLDHYGDEIICRFERMQEWRALSGKIDTGLFVASYYAGMDYKNGKTRSTFGWKNVIGHNNVQLNKMLSKGISENHFHLQGSVPYFELSWLALMNRVNNPKFSYLLDQIDNERRTPKMLYAHRSKEERYTVFHLQAALIRVYLFSELKEQKIKFDDYYIEWSRVWEYLFRYEPILTVLKNCGYDIVREVPLDLLNEKTEETTLREWFQSMLCVFKSGEERELIELKAEFKRCCSGFYWLMWESPFADREYIGNVNCSGENIILSDLCRIFTGLTKGYKYLPLEECCRIFDMDFYENEWKNQSRRAVKAFLQDTGKLTSSRDELQRIIDMFQDFFSNNKKDYAMNAAGSWYKDQNESAIMAGERWLLYTMQRRNYQERTKLDSYSYNLFFAYLVIKESFRRELVQSNARIGFTNFKKYQARKSWFTTDYSAGELAYIAVENIFKNENIKSLEIRIKPEDTCGKNTEAICYYDRAICVNRELRDRFYYVFHFSKTPDPDIRCEDELSQFNYRHCELREKVRRQAEAIVQFRKRNPEMARRVRGIDACSQEDGCRPEVFATAYRMLKSHYEYRGLSVAPEMLQLRATYHVGEDFQDILDGIRAIDEAICFLNLDRGDRLGHATALGLDVEKWYCKNSYNISIRLQDYLDNVVWLYHKLIAYHIKGAEPLMEYLKTEFQLYFSIIYEKSMDAKFIETTMMDACNYDTTFGQKARDGVNPYDININTYYYSWMLRGDNPQLYRDGYYKRIWTSLNRWEECSVNRCFPEEGKIRYILSANLLNYYYHYSPAVKSRGSKAVKVAITADMVWGIGMVQKELQKEIARREIAIETNPSSNVMISRIESYAEHPIVEFYNKGLVYEPNELEKCAQINVSVNTDDKGVFSTSLSNEYALLASALGQVKNADGKYVYKQAMIYDWISNIQEMGNQQSFIDSSAKY